VTGFIAIKELLANSVPLEDASSVMGYSNLQLYIGMVIFFAVAEMAATLIPDLVGLGQSL
jgi:hypothetical protein